MLPVSAASLSGGDWYGGSGWPWICAARASSKASACLRVPVASARAVGARSAAMTRLSASTVRMASGQTSSKVLIGVIRRGLPGHLNQPEQRHGGGPGMGQV